MPRFTLLDRLLFSPPAGCYSTVNGLWVRSVEFPGWGRRMGAVGRKGDGSKETVSRRDFLRVGGISVMALSVAERAALAARQTSPQWRSCIFLMMTGGPSQLDTFDPKPDAPAEIRGPVRTIRTAVPGVLLAESLPKLAQRSNDFALLRSLGHDAAPIHETGQQLLQTGRLARNGLRPPSFGSVVSKELGSRGSAPAYCVLPRLLGATGVATWQGQGAGSLGAEFEPLTIAGPSEAAVTIGSPVPKDAAPAIVFPEEPANVRDSYGETRFGRLCLQARQLVEAGVRCVTVNLFDTLSGELTWDSHGRAPWAPSTVYDYRDKLCPQFDRAASALLDDLKSRGLLDDTLVIATGEFGRTPRLNEDAGRDHWPTVWSALMAGGGIQGGQVIGGSDAQGAYALDRPIHPAELTATIYRSLGVTVPTEVVGETESVESPKHPAIAELFA